MFFQAYELFYLHLSAHSQRLSLFGQAAASRTDWATSRSTAHWGRVVGLSVEDPALPASAAAGEVVGREEGRSAAAAARSCEEEEGRARWGCTAAAADVEVDTLARVRWGLQKDGRGVSSVFGLA